jgi:hypothetical protein
MGKSAKEASCYKSSLHIWWIAHQWTHQISFFSRSEIALWSTQKNMLEYKHRQTLDIYVYYLKKGCGYLWLPTKNHDYFLSSIYLVVSPQNVSFIDCCELLKPLLIN